MENLQIVQSKEIDHFVGAVYRSETGEVIEHVEFDPQLDESLDWAATFFARLGVKRDDLLKKVQQFQAVNS